MTNRDAALETTDDSQWTQRWERLPARVFAFLISVDLLLIAAYALAIILGLAKRKGFNVVDLDVENNPAGWFASVQYVVAALPFLGMGIRLLQPRRPAAALWRLWLTLGVGLLLLSADEGASLHERLGRVGSKVGAGISTHGGAAWIVVYLVIAVGLAWLLRREILVAWQDWRVEFLTFAIGFMVLVLGGGIFETIGHVVNFTGTLKLAEVGVEEGFELIGVSLMALSAYRILSRSIMGAPGRIPAASPLQDSAGS